MRQLFQIAIFLIVIAIFATTRCSTGSRYMEEGLDKVIKSYSAVPNFTILLDDMDYANGDYLHQYRVLTMSPDSTFDEQTTEWLEVSPRFFRQNQGNLGMELASKEDGQLTKNVAPAGYSQYVGNPRYGRWEDRNGTSFWVFYGRYAMLRSAFNMGGRPARYDYWDTYDREYRSSGAPYYGRGGYYGTDSYVNSNPRGKQSTWGRRPASFKESVRNRVSRSNSTTSRTSRSSSRYSSSSTRSRSSGGFGK